MSRDKVQFHFRRLDVARRDRGNFDSQWEEAAARVIPAHRSSFTGRGLDNVFGAGGQKKTEEMIDATAALANLRFSAVLESLGTPQSSVWHLLKPADKTLKNNRAVRIYFDEVNDILFSYRYRPVANFVANIQQCYGSVGAYGNATLFVDRPDETPGLRYKYLHLGETYYFTNHAGVIDTLYRPFWLDARQAVQKFPKGLPDAITTAANSEQSDRKFEFLHCIYPSTDYSPGGIGVKGMRFASLYISRQEEKIIEEGGYHSFPAPSARYTVAPGETYGRGPAQWVLPAIKTLNEQKKTVLKQGHRNVDPVLLAHDDGVIDGFSMRAGAINKGAVTADGKMLVHPLPVGNIAVGEKMMEMERGIIQDAFLITLFQILVDTPQMTATEVLERAREKGMLIAPTAGALQAGFLGPMIERELDLLMQQGLLPDMPPILAATGGSYKIEYDSPMSRMMRAEKAAGFLRAFGVATDFAQRTGDRSALDWFNIDAAMPEIMDIQGSPTAWSSTPEEVAKMREQRAQDAQEQKMIEAAPAAAGLLKAAPEIMNSK